MQNYILLKIKEIKKNFFDELKDINSEELLDKLQNKYTGKNGLLFILTEGFKKCNSEEKKKIGNSLVSLKKEINDTFVTYRNKLFLISTNFPNVDYFDPALIKKDFVRGSLHPYTLALRVMNDFFISMGFHIIDGNIITDEYSNFTSLNIPQDHSARDEHDTFWVLSNKTLLRTHTSNVQVQASSKLSVPFGIFSPGLVYRNEATDMSHDFMFAQVEGMYFGDDASIASLLYVLRRLFNVYFEKENLNIRARPGIFPFVEPGLEVDFECPFCLKGCSTCKYSRWIELGGAGMVHQFVKKEMKLDSNQRGWAFGLGLTRMVMLKHGIGDIRKLHKSYTGA